MKLLTALAVVLALSACSWDPSPAELAAIKERNRLQEDERRRLEDEIRRHNEQVLRRLAEETKRVMDSWYGRHKSELILAWGPYSDLKSDGKGGEILIYVFGYGRRMFYSDDRGIIYHWVAEGL